MTLNYQKKLKDMNQSEQNYFQMEVGQAVEKIIHMNGRKGDEFLLAVATMLRDEAGRRVYGQQAKEQTEGREASETDPTDIFAE